MVQINTILHVDGLVQDCSIPSVLAMEILQSCIKPSISTATTKVKEYTVPL